MIAAPSEVHHSVQYAIQYESVTEYFSSGAMPRRTSRCALQSNFGCIGVAVCEVGSF